MILIEDISSISSESETDDEYIVDPCYLDSWVDLQTALTPFIFANDEVGFNFTSFYNPIDYLLYFIDDELVNLIVPESNRHGAQNLNYC